MDVLSPLLYIVFMNVQSACLFPTYMYDRHKSLPLFQITGVQKFKCLLLIS